MKSKNILLQISLFLVLALVITPGGVVSAQQPTAPTDDEVNAIARQLYCPVCENTPLDVCPTVACHDWREQIRQMLADGKSETEIKQYFVDYYGARVLSEPQFKGLNLLIYIVPPVAFLTGAVLLILAFRTWKRRPQTITSINQSPSYIPETIAPNNSDAADGDKYIDRIEAELRKRK